MCFIKHDWEEINRNRLVSSTWPVNAERDVTIVAFRCKKCKHYKQQELDGWLPDEK
jgi:hypothetical protein